MVRHTLVVKPDVSNRELLARAKEIAPEAVAGLSLRQFHGKFRLPVIRFEMTPKQKKNGASPKPAAESSAGSKTETQATPQAAKSAAAPSRKRGRKKAANSAVAIDGAVRDVLIDFAVELEKAESRSELVSVIAGVDSFVKRIVTVADSAYGGRSSRSAA